MLSGMPGDALKLGASIVGTGTTMEGINQNPACEFFLSLTRLGLCLPQHITGTLLKCMLAFHRLRLYV